VNGSVKESIQTSVKVKIEFRIDEVIRPIVYILKIAKLKNEIMAMC
jgi:hypothetical protein